MAEGWTSSGQTIATASRCCHLDLKFLLLEMRYAKFIRDTFRMTTGMSCCVSGRQLNYTLQMVVKPILAAYSKETEQYNSK